MGRKKARDLINDPCSLPNSIQVHIANETDQIAPDWVKSISALKHFLNCFLSCLAHHHYPVHDHHHTYDEVF